MKKTILLLLYICFVSHMAVATDRTQLVKPERDEGAQNLKHVRTPNPKDDQKNEQIIKNLLQQAGWFPHINVAVKEGVVEIKGEVDQKSQIDWLIQTIDRLPTVLAVIDKTELKRNAIVDLTPAVDELKKSVDKTKRELPRIAVGVLMFLMFGLFSYFLNKAVHKLWIRKTPNPFLQTILTKLTMVPIIAVFIFLIFKVVGLTGLAATIVGGTGLIGIVLGFAFKGVAENYLSGVMLAMRSPFTRGDEVRVGDYTGYVQALSMRGTTLIDYDGNHVLIPNSIITSSPIQNISSNPNTRLQFTITIDAKTIFKDAQDIIMDVLLNVDQVLKDPEPSALADALSGSNLIIKIYAWYDGKKSSPLKLKSILLSKIRDVFAEKEIYLADEVQKINVGSFHPESNEKITHRKTPVRHMRTKEEYTTQADCEKEDLLKHADRHPINDAGSEENLLK